MNRAKSSGATQTRSFGVKRSPRSSSRAVSRAESKNSDSEPTCIFMCVSETFGFPVRIVAPIPHTALFRTIDTGSGVRNLDFAVKSRCDTPECWSMAMNNAVISSGFVIVNFCKMFCNGSVSVIVVKARSSLFDLTCRRLVAAPRQGVLFMLLKIRRGNRMTVMESGVESSKPSVPTRPRPFPNKDMPQPFTLCNG